MLVKFFTHGSGQSGGIDYLFSERDSDGKLREKPPVLLRGDPELSKSIIDGTNFAQRYTSGVLSFNEFDLPDEIKNSIVESFEKNAIFPGLSEERYNTLWVQHQDKGRLELHFVIPNQDLETGKRLQPYFHLSDKPRINNWKKCINYDYELTSPDAPSRKQIMTLSNNLPKEKKEAAELIKKAITREVSEGRIIDRNTLITFLQESGINVSRQTNQSISIKINEGDRPIRLKGAVYEQSFRGGKALGEQVKREEREYKKQLSEDIGRSRIKLEEQISKKRLYLEKLYGRRVEYSQEDPNRIIANARVRIKAESLEYKKTPSRNQIGLESHDDAELLGGSSLIPRSVIGNIGDRKNYELANSGPIQKEGRTLKRGHNDVQQELGTSVFEKRKGEICSDTARVSNRMDLWKESVHQAQRLGDLYDRIGTRAREITEKVGDIVRRTREKIDEFFRRTDELFIKEEQGIVKSSRGTGSLCKEAHRTIQTSEQSFERGVTHMRDELERFKTDINLSEYMALHGYSLSLKESSKTSAIMRHDNRDKLVVTRNKNNHWVYFSVRDNSDNGSIIDFHQKRTGNNLGKTRQELRGFHGLPALNGKFMKTKDRAKILCELEGMKIINNHSYLAQRGINKTLLENERFRETIKLDAHNNVVFPHRDKSGNCGYELKNQKFTGFSPGGEKGVWHSNVFTTDKNLVLTESAIDALSYHQINRDKDTRYFSVGGALSSKQLGIIKSAIDKMASGSKIILAFDNDVAGRELSKSVTAVITRKDLLIEIKAPTIGKDWNEQLQKQLVRSRGL